MHRLMIVAAAIVVGLTNAAAADQGNAQNGKLAFAACQMCHTNIRGAPNGIGPNLTGIAGRKAANLPGFYYSVALKNSKIVWTNDKLKAWIMNPQKLVPGNRMTFVGVSDPAKAGDIVAYLDTLK